MRLNKLLPSLRALQSKSKKSSIQMNQILTKLSKLSMKRSSERSLRKLTLNFLKLKKMQPNSLKRKLSNGLRLPKKRKREEPDSIKERKLILTTQWWKLKNKWAQGSLIISNWTQKIIMHIWTKLSEALADTLMPSDTMKITSTIELLSPRLHSKITTMKVSKLIISNIWCTIVNKQVEYDEFKEIMKAGFL